MPPRTACCLTALAALGSARSSQPKAHRVSHPYNLARDSFRPSYRDSARCAFQSIASDEGFPDCKLSCRYVKPSPDRTWTVRGEAEHPARGLIAGCLDEDYRVLTATSGRPHLEMLRAEESDLVLCDQALPDMTGVEFFSQIRVANPEAIRVLLTERRDPDEAIRSINEAAVYQIISRPGSRTSFACSSGARGFRELARLHRYLGRELKFADEVLRQQNGKMTTQLQSAYEFDRLVFASDSMIEVCNLARQAAATDLPVLIQGETGTGKELMARAVHFFSGQNKYPFLAQNCAALPDELLHSELFGHKRAPSRARSATGWACSPRPTGAPCSWTRSAMCLRRSRSACCGCCRTAR